MGFAKQRELELESKNLRSIPDKSICSKHFENNAIRNFIRKNYQDGYCDYCNKELKVIEFEELMNFIMDGINFFYQDAGNFMAYNSREGGYLGTTFSPEELIDEIGLDAEPYEVIEDVIDCIEDIAWANSDLYYLNPSQELKYDWKYFKEIIKHTSRYLFVSDNEYQKNALKVLNEVGNIIKNSNLIKKLPKGTILYRCRQHTEKEIIDIIEKIVSPPNQCTLFPNRFSPSGISMFYSAFDKNTAIKETVSRECTGNRITIAELETLEDCYIVDFSNLPSVQSIFEVNDKNRYYINIFLHGFVRDITKQVVKDGREHTEYVPTQVVTEFLRFPFNKNRKRTIDGIVYPSSLNECEKSSVFFWDHKLSLKKVKLNSIFTEIYE